MNCDYLPTNGKVVIVDDKDDEVKPLQNLFAEKGIPYIFYNYSVFRESEIQKPDSVRIVFLDICLEDGNTGSQNIASVLASVIEKIIIKENGPYTIIFWTNNIEIENEITRYLTSYLDKADNTTKPIDICALDKKEFINQPDEKLIKDLSLLLSKQKIISFFIQWEKKISSISSDTLKKFLYSSRLITDKDSIVKLFNSLAFLENDELNDKFSGTKTILYTLGEFLKDRYLEIISEKQIINDFSNYIDYDFSKISKKELPIETRASINSLLNVNVYDSKDRYLPGKVFVLPDGFNHFDTEGFKKNTLNKWYDNNKMKIEDKNVDLELSLIEVDITPSCDYAQNKNSVLRTLFGYMVEIKTINDENGKAKWLNEEYSKKIKNKISFDYIYVTPEFKINDNIYVFAINTKYMTIEKHNFCDNYRYLMRFNSEILTEIRKKTGDIITRIGINSL